MLPAQPGTPIAPDRELSIVVPVYNSEASLPMLADRLAAVLPKLARRYEVILVNDGSRDESWNVVRRLAEQHGFVRGICLMRNFGQHNALLCGIRAARYSVIVTMDDDLQHPPEEIPKLLAKLDEGYDVVYGTPIEQQHGLVRDWLSILAKRGLAMAMGIKNIGDISAFRILRTHLRDASAGYQSPHVLLDVLLSWGTTKFTTAAVEHQPRKIGQSNYTPSKLFNQAMLILTGFSTAPLRVATTIGLAFTVFGVAIFTYVIIRYCMGGTLPGFTFLASLIALFSGAQMFALGILGEYLARIFHRSSERPTYVIRDPVVDQVESSGGVGG
jgi:glycosyltransferase involved in cell wall biosynthesis